MNEIIRKIKLHIKILSTVERLNGTPRSNGTDETISGKKKAGE